MWIMRDTISKWLWWINWDNWVETPATPVEVDRFWPVDSYPNPERVALIEEQERADALKRQSIAEAKEVMVCVPVEQVDFNDEWLELHDNYWTHEIINKMIGHFNRLSQENQNSLNYKDIQPIVSFRINWVDNNDPVNLMVTRPLILGWELCIVWYIPKKWLWSPVIYKKASDWSWRHFSVDNNKIFDTHKNGDTNRSRVCEYLGKEFDWLVGDYKTSLIKVYDKDYLSEFFRMYNHIDNPNNTLFLDNGLFDQFRSLYKDLFNDKSVNLITTISSINYPTGFLPDFENVKLMHKYTINLTFDDVREVEKCPVYVLPSKMWFLWHFTYSERLQKVWISNITLKKTLANWSVFSNISNSGVYSEYLKAGILTLDPRDKELESKWIDIEQVLNALAPIKWFISWLNNRAKKK